MKTKTKILKVFAIVAIFLGNSHLMAQTVTTTNIVTQIRCVNTLNEPYEVIYNTTSTYTWSMIDQTTGVTPLAGVADITVSVNDWLIYVDWTTPGVYELSVVEKDGATQCESSPVVLTITVEDNANTPIAVDPPDICLGDPNPTFTASTGGGTGSGVFNWYDSDPSVNPSAILLGSNPTYSEPINYAVATTYSYWVTEQSANGCEGPATMVSVNVLGLPTLPTLVSLPYSACFGYANPVFTASGAGTNFNWYDIDPIANPGAIPLNPTYISTYTSVEINPNTYTYFVEEIVGSCTSLPTSFTFTINAPPASPTISPLTVAICEGDVPVDFTVTSGGANGVYDWYDIDPVANPSASSIGNGSPFAPIQTIAGTYTYYVTETDLTTTCISVPSSSVFIINELPLQPIVAASPSAVICDGQTPPVFTATQDPLSTGTSDFNWYDDDPANPSAILLGNGATFTPSQTAVGLYTFWLTESNNITGCEGAALSFTFEIVVLPAAPTLIPNPVEICFGDINPPFIPTGVSSSGANLIWYDVDPSTLGAISIGTGATFTAPGTVVGNAASVTTYSYWVVDQPGNCVSPALQVDLQINPLPTPGPIWHN
jgi:hypothetical protein